MKRGFVFLCVSVSVCALLAQKPTWNESKIEALTNMCESKLTKTFLIYQDGEMKFEYGDSSEKFKIFSIRKSLVSLLYGIYVEEGKIDLNASLADLGIDDIQGLTADEKSATITNLLQARSGVYHNAAFETPGMVKKRPERGSYKPGEFWYYNNWDFNALTSIFEQETNTSVFKAFEEKIAKPLGFQDFEIADQEYILEEERSIHKATLWWLSGRDMLELGKMLLEDGRYGKKQIVPEGWIKESTREHSDIGMFGAWGLCWWLTKNGKHYPFVTLPDGTFMGIGTGMQHFIVVPEYNMIMVHQTDVEGPDAVRMKITDLGRMLKIVMDQ